MLTGTCHCGAVRFSLAARPEYLLSCNCSLCRRVAALWAYGNEENVTVTGDESGMVRYTQGDKTLALYTCLTCGCTTHWTSLLDERPRRMAINSRLCDPAETADIPRRRFDGADTWTILDE